MFINSCNFHLCVSHFLQTLILDKWLYFLQTLSFAYPHCFRSKEVYEAFLTFLKHDDDVVCKFILYFFFIMFILNFHFKMVLKAIYVSINPCTNPFPHSAFQHLKKKIYLRSKCFEVYLIIAGDCTLQILSLTGSGLEEQHPTVYM